MPLGVVSSINGSTRYAIELFGMASHAGTTPCPCGTMPPQLPPS